MTSLHHGGRLAAALVTVTTFDHDINHRRISFCGLAPGTQRKSHRQLAGKLDDAGRAGLGGELGSPIRDLRLRDERAAERARPMTGAADSGVRAHVIIRGWVQNVFFRASCRGEATRLGVNGFISNLRDGRVEAVFEGDTNAVRAIVEWCRHGPPDAIVESIDVTYEEPVGETGFRVR